MDYKNNKKMNSIQKMIKAKETEAFKFVPNPDFYKSININQKRWGMIFKGKIEPTITELQHIAEYFDVPIYELIDEKNNSPAQ